MRAATCPFDGNEADEGELLQVQHTAMSPSLDLLDQCVSEVLEDCKLIASNH